jgi:hypothetical protein
MLIEHLFVGEMMRRLWLRGIAQFEVLKPEVNDGGYDLVVEANGIARHIQLKSSFKGARTGQVKVSLNLAHKPSACVIWILFDSGSMELGPFLWFGGRPGEAMPAIDDFKKAKHTRANADGVKKERPNQRSIPRAQFERIEEFDKLVSRMFGEL